MRAMAYTRNPQGQGDPTVASQKTSRPQNNVSGEEGWDGVKGTNY